jgi:hypothetical protein
MSMLLYLTALCAHGTAYCSEVCQLCPVSCMPCAPLQAFMYLTALGSGGIKPCVSSFGGDQFKETSARERWDHAQAFRTGVKADLCHLMQQSIPKHVTRVQAMEAIVCACSGDVPDTNICCCVQGMAFLFLQLVLCLHQHWIPGESPGWCVHVRS